jgi:hypothetical protein
MFSSDSCFSLFGKFDSEKQIHSYPWPPIAGQRVRARKGVLFDAYSSMFDKGTDTPLQKSVGDAKFEMKGKFYSLYEAVITRVNKAWDNRHGLAVQSYDIFFPHAKRPAYNVYVELECMYPSTDSLNTAKFIGAAMLRAAVTVAVMKRATIFAEFAVNKKSGKIGKAELNFMRWKNENAEKLDKYNSKLPDPDKIEDLESNFPLVAWDEAARRQQSSQAGEEDPCLKGFNDASKYMYIGGYEEAQERLKKDKKKKVCS